MACLLWHWIIRTFDAFKTIYNSIFLNFCLKKTYFFIILLQVLVFINKLEICNQRKLLKIGGKYFDKKYNWPETSWEVNIWSVLLQESLPYSFFFYTVHIDQKAIVFHPDWYFSNLVKQWMNNKNLTKIWKVRLNRVNQLTEISLSM